MSGGKQTNCAYCGKEKLSKNEIGLNKKLIHPADRTDDVSDVHGRVFRDDGRGSERDDRGIQAARLCVVRVRQGRKMFNSILGRG